MKRLILVFLGSLSGVAIAFGLNWKFSLVEKVVLALNLLLNLADGHGALILVVVSVITAMAFLIIAMVVKKTLFPRLLSTILVAVTVGAVSWWISGLYFWLGTMFAFLTTIFLVVTGLKKTPANPPHKSLLTFFGRRTRVVLGEGWNFLPLYPLFNRILVNVTKKNKEFPPQRVRTPDRAEISVSASVTWEPGIKGCPRSYVEYLNSGGEQGVTEILGNIIEDRVKTWAGSNKEGPSSWLEALALRDEAHGVLAKALLGDALEQVPSDIPTTTWIRFFANPQTEPNNYDVKSGWGTKNGDVWGWTPLERIFDNLQNQEKILLRRGVEKRIEDIKKLRQGGGEFPIEKLGITILRFSLGEIKVEGEVAKAAELEEKERRERDADTLEIDNVSQRILQLRQAHPELTMEDAIRLVQIERDKATKTIIDITGAKTGIGNDLLGFASLFGGAGGVNSERVKTTGVEEKAPDEMNDEELRQWARRQRSR